MKPHVNIAASQARPGADRTQAFFFRIPLFIGLALALLSAMPAHTFAKDGSKVSGAFQAGVQASGVGANARGKVNFRLRNGGSVLKLNLRRLDADSPHSLRIGTLVVRDFLTNRSGKANVTLNNPAPDPRGKSMTVEDENGRAVLAIANFSGLGAPGNISHQEDNTLTPTGAPVGSEAKTRLRVKKGRAIFKIEVEGMTPGDLLDVFIGAGATNPVGTILVESDGEGEIKFDTRPSDNPDVLPFPDPPFDPLDPVRIEQNSIVLFNGALGDSVTACAPAPAEEMLVRTDLGTLAAPAGTAVAQLETKADCDVSFEVEVEDVPESEGYQLYVGFEADGITPKLRGTFDVGADGRGRIEFETHADAAGDLELDFNPSGQPILILPPLTQNPNDAFFIITSPPGFHPI